MALSSTSSLQNAVDQYLDNLSWDGDVTKARAALEAIRYIEACRPRVLTTGTGEVNYEGMMQQRRALEEFLGRADTANQPRASFVRGRALT